MGSACAASLRSFGTKRASPEFPIATHKFRSQPRYLTRLIGECEKARRKSASDISASAESGGLKRENVGIRESGFGIRGSGFAAGWPRVGEQGLGTRDSGLEEQGLGARGWGLEQKGPGAWDSGLGISI